MNRKFKKIDGIEYEIITKKEWKEKGHTSQEGKKYIMRYDDKRGTILRWEFYNGQNESNDHGSRRKAKRICLVYRI